MNRLALTGRPNHPERWQSGRMQRTRNGAYRQVRAWMGYRRCRVPRSLTSFEMEVSIGQIVSRSLVARKSDLCRDVLVLCSGSRIISRLELGHCSDDLPLSRPYGRRAARSFRTAAKSKVMLEATDSGISQTLAGAVNHEEAGIGRPRVGRLVYSRLVYQLLDQSPKLRRRRLASHDLVVADPGAPQRLFLDRIARGRRIPIARPPWYSMACLGRQ
jgi:hypothetical protein